MRPQVSTFAVVIITFFILLTSCDKEEGKWSKTQLRFITEEYAPFNFTDNSTASGLATDLLRDVCSWMDIDCQIEFLPWEEGYNEVLTTDNTVLFSTVLNSTRRDKFKWAGPYASFDWNFYAAKRFTNPLITLTDPKAVGKIGVIANYAIEQYLAAEGYTNLVYCTDINDCLTKLLNGEIDLFPSDKYTTEIALKSMGQTTYAVISQMTIKTDFIYFAFNINVSDEFIADFQQAIDLTKKNGLLRELTQKYLHTSVYPDILQLYTEPYPPLTFKASNDEISGFGTDIVYEIMKRNNVCYDIKLSSWSNGYQLALVNPNFCIFTMDRTVIREDLFQWVGPIGTNTTWFYTKKGSGITITSLDDAKNLNSIGAVNSWFSTQHLQSHGFTNLIMDSNPEVLAEKLMNGEVNAFVCSDITFPDILNQQGFDYTAVNPSYALMSSDYYIGFSTSTSETIINQWQSALDAIKLDGTYAIIHQQWFP